MTDRAVDGQAAGVASAGVFREVGQTTVTRGVPMSHLSIEVGHFYMEDLRHGPARIEEQFRRVAPFVQAAMLSAQGGNNPPRVSTCFLVDDYFVDDTVPTTLLGMLLPAAAKAGLRLDYVAREAGCAMSGDVRLADLVAARLHSEPSPGTNGSRPPVKESGWLANGSRSPGFDAAEAMQTRAWQPPREFAPRNHSIFLDVELWRDVEDVVGGVSLTQRTWSCPFLASVWHLLRLGMLRNYGHPVAEPVQWRDGEWPSQWAELPTVIQLNPEAHAFAAYRAVSVMPHSYLPIEHAVRTILDHVVVDPEVLALTAERALREGIRLPASPSDRLTHLFVEEHWDDD